MIFFGEFAALLAALLWSVNAIVLSEALNKVGSFNVNIGRLFFASIFLLITIVIFSLPFNLYWQQYFYLILSGIIGLVIGDLGMLKSYQLIGPRLGMLMMSFVPSISVILAFLFLDEVLTTNQILGIIITSIGLAIVILQKKPISEKFHFTIEGGFYGLIAAVGQAVGLIFAKEAFNFAELNEFVAAFIRIVFSLILLILLGISTVLDWIPLVGQFLSLPFKIFYFILFYTTFKPSLKEIITPFILDNIPILNILPISLIFFLRFLGLLPKGPF